MAKAFLSHSSSDKPFVSPIAEQLGDMCVFDEVTFETSEETLESIISNISRSDLFVFFISSNSLNSEWVKREFHESNLLSISQGLDRIFPILIDDNISWDDPRIPKILKRFTLRHIKNSRVALHKISNRLRRIAIENVPTLKRRDEIFIGRKTSLAELEELYLESIDRRPNVVIASGMEGVGRRKFLFQGLRELKVIGEDATQPFIITLDSKNSVEDLILQLTDLDTQDIEGVLSRMDVELPTKITIAQECVNEYIKHSEIIFILDHGCIVKPSLKIADWFLDIINNNALGNRVVFAIASRFRPNASEIRRANRVIHINLPALSPVHVRSLFHHYSEAIDLKLTQPDADYFIENLQGFPEQVFAAVERIKRDGLGVARTNIKELIAIGDEKVSRTIETISTDEEAFSILVLLAHIGIVSFDFLETVVDNNELLYRTLEKFYSISLYDIIGPDSSMIKPNYMVADYINRFQYNLNDRYEQRLKDTIGRILVSSSDEDRIDISMLSYSVKEKLKVGQQFPRYILTSNATFC